MRGAQKEVLSNPKHLRSMTTIRRLLPIGLTLIWLAAVICSATSAPDGSLKFASGDNGEFTFDTGVLRGKLRAGGKSTGLSSVVHIPTATRLDSSMGLFSHYRLFTANHRYGTAGWDFPSEAKLAPDGSVEVRWADSPDRPFQLRAVYRWSAPNILDLQTTVVARTNLHDFESFLASYFSSGFTNAAVCAGPQTGTAFIPAEKSAGVWLAFPRDDQAVSIIQDGRWKIEPNPVDWVVMPRLSRNLAFRRCPDNNLVAVIMSPPQDAFAVLTPFQSEPHRSTYLCLFGRDLKPGETASARSRLLIAQGLTEPRILSLYEEYLR